MATQVKPTRLKITGTPSAGQVPMYVDADNFQWGSAGSSGYGRFLSLWDCTTGQPISFPETTPYIYATGDYFMVSVVSTATPPVNYRPNGSSYTGTASSTTESDEVLAGDVYVYDGSVWLLQSNNEKTVAFANIAGQPTDNTNLASALSGKLDTSALSDTNYGGAWSGDTTHAATKNAIYTKIHTMDVEIGNKAADNTVVKLSGNQTINGTKTFTTSPVVPSKTSDATNDGTAIATEAQVYKKADAVDVNTKAFYLSSTSDLTNAQAAYDWYKSGKNAIVITATYPNIPCFFSSVSSTKIIFKSTVRAVDVSSYSGLTPIEIQFTLSSDTVTAITNQQSSIARVLGTNVDYPTPYTPQYDGSPATKKYVDDRAGDGTKIFTLTNTSDTTNAQLAYDYYINGGVPVLHIGTAYYHIANFLSASNGRRLEFSNMRTSGTWIGLETITIETDSNGTVTTITSNGNTINLTNTAPGSSTPNTTITFVS